MGARPLLESVDTGAQPVHEDQWATIGNYTKFGQWNASTSECNVFVGWKTIAISSDTGRVRLTSQTIRSDGTFAGTFTLAGYITPAGVEPCVEL